MNKSEKDAFDFGYSEARGVVLSQLKEILREDSDGEIVKLQLELLIHELELDIEKANWRAIQEEFPGITEEEYEAEQEASADEIRKTYFSENGFLKPRLVRQAPKASENDDQV